MQFSALQLAWMQELGIDKPWIPGGAKPTVIQPAAAANPVTGAEANLRVAQPAEQNSEAGAFVQAGRLARGQVQAATMSPVITLRSATGSASSTKQSTDTANAPQLDTVAAAAQATTLEALAATIAQCNACGLCKEREQVVVGQGVMQPAIMVIGEGPGDQEDRQGLPFVGRSGMLLDNMLSSIGSSRTKDVYAANVVKCRPPGNRNPRPNEIAACRPFLMRQIELVRPVSILALGRFAAQTLLGVEAQLAEMREKPFAIEHAGRNIPVVVSYHPAYLLRRPVDKAAAWRDLQHARVISKGNQ